MEREVAVWTLRVYTEIARAAEEVAKSQGFEIVVTREEIVLTRDPQQIRDQIRNRKVVWASAATDLSQAVLDKLNADYRAQPRQRMLMP
jgi:Skp family chaperone for outer membrane proteins